MSTVSRSTSASAKALLGRRDFIRLAGTVGVGVLGVAAAASLSGCGFFGGDEPQPESEPQPLLPPNAVDFENLVFTLETDTSTWWWGQLDNVESSANGAVVVGIPVTELNNDELSRVVNSLYCKVVAPSGEELPDISGFYSGDDILQKGSIAIGETVSGVLHFPYAGPGTYTVQFDNLLGGKASLPFEIAGSQANGLRAYPSTMLNQADAEKAAYFGTQFDVNGMTLTLSADTSTYYWTQLWSGDEHDGLWCVAVPLTVYNGADYAQTVTFDMYALFGPTLERIYDPGAYYQDTHVSFQPAVEPGQTFQTWLWWPYLGDGSYYACFDNAGVKQPASVYFTWPEGM